MDKTKQLSDYPEYVVAAVEWWTEEISGAVSGPKILAIIHEFFTKKILSEDMETFQTSLAESIQKDLSEWPCAEVYIDEMGPCYSLVKATEKAGMARYLDERRGRIKMLITRSNVSVVSGQAPYRTIWSFIH